MEARGPSRDAGHAAQDRVQSAGPVDRAADLPSGRECATGLPARGLRPGVPGIAARPTPPPASASGRTLPASALAPAQGAGSRRHAGHRRLRGADGSAGSRSLPGAPGGRRPGADAPDPPRAAGTLSAAPASRRGAPVRPGPGAAGRPAGSHAGPPGAVGPDRPGPARVGGLVPAAGPLARGPRRFSRGRPRAGHDAGTGGGGDPGCFDAGQPPGLRGSGRSAGHGEPALHLCRPGPGGGFADPAGPGGLAPVRAPPLRVAGGAQEPSSDGRPPGSGDSVGSHAGLGPGRPGGLLAPPAGAGRAGEDGAGLGRPGLLPSQPGRSSGLRPVALAGRPVVPFRPVRPG